MELEPMLARTASSLPSGRSWVFEPKWDGFRVLARVGAASAAMTSRSGRRLDSRFPEVAAALAAALPAGTTLDGELVCWHEQRLDFDALQRRQRVTVATARRLAATEPCHLIAFDLLEQSDAQVWRRGLATRRALLEEAFADVQQPSPLTLGWQTRDREEALGWYDGLAAIGVEGLVAKDLRRSYRPGHRGWLKIKRRITTEAIVGGIVGTIERPRALILGRRDPDSGQLRVAGRSTELIPALRVQLDGLLHKTTDHPWPARLPTAGGWDVDRSAYVRVEPEAVVEIAPDTAVSAHRWRHPVPVVRVRADLRPQDVPKDLDLEA